MGIAAFNSQLLPCYNGVSANMRSVHRFINDDAAPQHMVAVCVRGMAQVLESLHIMAQPKPRLYCSPTTDAAGLLICSNPD